MFVVKDDSIRISIRNLVEYIYRSGDYGTTGSGLADVKAMLEGARIHRRLQKAAGSRYNPEVTLKLQIPRQTLASADDAAEAISYVIELEGRADGIICDLEVDAEGNKLPISDVIIDEIKTTQKDVKKLKEPEYVHKAQAMCYAYIFAKRHSLEEITVQITYCNPDTEELNRFSECLNMTELTQWFEGLIESFAKWSDFVFISRRQRRESIEGVGFPFEYREGQRNLVVNVYRAIERERNLYIQASTGVGKTISTIFPSVAAMGQGMVDKIFYLTSKTITRKVAEDTYELLRDKGLRFRCVTLTARDKICPLDKRVCDPSVCERARGHFDRVNDALYDLVTNNYRIDAAVVSDYAAGYNVCPFELGLDASYWCDGIICDYNYVFDPNVALKRYFSNGAKGDYVFLVDEAHNLVDRARQMYSAVLVKEDVLRIKRLLAGSDKFEDKKLDRALNRLNKELLELKRECDTYRVLPAVHSLGKLPLLVEMLSLAISAHLEKHVTADYRQELLEFYFDLKHFLNIYDGLDDKYVIYTEHDSNGDFCVQLYCVDPSGNISARTGLGRNTIFFSATLLPVNYYKEMLTGDTSEYAIYARSSFPKERRRILIGPDVSSRFKSRNQKTYMDVADYIYRVVNAHRGKYMVFFPSYGFMEAVYREFEDRYRAKEISYTDEAKAEGEESGESGADYVYCVRQQSDMGEAQRLWFIDCFDSREYENSLVGFCVTGGMFSEGIDLREESLIGAIVVGTGLPMICRQRDILKDYFDEHGRDGFDYAYVYPGMNKVLQAAGRVIRTDEDAGVIVLLDDRFIREDYRRLFPAEWEDTQVVGVDSVATVIKHFWDEL